LIDWLIRTKHQASSSLHLKIASFRPSQHSQLDPPSIATGPSALHDHPEKFAEQSEDVEGLRKIREEKKLHSFGEGGDEELKMDVTRMMPDEAAWKIFEHIREGFVYGMAPASSS
jgi:hypothetical protein